ncbi:MAG TPA: hypothetical protein VGF76_16040, partial [Polyangiaceae bacterium]
MTSTQTDTPEAEPSAPALAGARPADLRVDQCRLSPPGLFLYNLLYWPYLLVSCSLLFFPALLLWALTFWDPKRRWLAKFT